MPVLSPLLALTVSTRAQANAFAPQFAVPTRSVRSTSDVLELDLVITAELAAALESSERFAGVEIKIDKGDGEMVPLLQTEIEGLIEMHGSRDGYGARTLSFVLQVPPSQSPFYSAWPRGPHRVSLTGFLGMPGAMQPRPMFDGFVTQCSWEAYPSLLRVQCQDASVRWASEMIAYNLEPGSRRTRKSVFLDVLALYGIPYGRLDFGSNDGGLLQKGISEGGTVSLLQWMTAYLTPIARRMTWDGGVCNVEPSYNSGSPVRTFRSNDIVNLTASLPATTDTNAVVMSSTVFGYVGPSGQRTEIEIKLTRALFAPETATRRQDHLTGDIESLSITIAPAVQEVTRTVTKRVYDAGTIVTTTVEEWGWYSALVCRREQAADTGDISFNSSFDVFLYADGSSRLEAQQQYQILRFSQNNKIWNSDGTLYTEESAQSQFGIGIVQTAAFNDDVTERPVHAFLADDGVAWADGREYYGGTPYPNRPQTINEGFAYTVTRTLYSSDEAGHLTRTYKRTLTYGDFYTEIGTETLDVIRDNGGFSTSSPGASAFGIFQTATGKRYGISYHGLGGFMTNGFPVAAYVTKFFTAVDETSHREQTIVAPESGFRWGVELDYQHQPAIPPSSDLIVAGAVPMIERLTSGQVSQPASVTVIDSIRSGLMGKILRDYQQNDFCETVEELKVCALELLREKAPAPEWDSLIDWTVVPGSSIALLLPDAIPTGEVMTAWSVDWTFDGRSADNKQHVTARWLPRELR